MPVINGLRARAAGREDELQAGILAELRNPRDEGEPVIIVEPGGPKSLHLYVIWADFAGVDQVVRSSIILDAFAQHDADRARDVTVAMGLTPDEAQRMNIYTP